MAARGFFDARESERVSRNSSSKPFPGDSEPGNTRLQSVISSGKTEEAFPGYELPIPAAREGDRGNLIISDPWEGLTFISRADVEWSLLWLALFTGNVARLLLSGWNIL